ncbi:unnamed protein product, partial [Ambrosiozyma monospora]
MPSSPLRNEIVVSSMLDPTLKSMLEKYGNPVITRAPRELPRTVSDPNTLTSMRNRELQNGDGRRPILAKKQTLSESMAQNTINKIRSSRRFNSATSFGNSFRHRKTRIRDETQTETKPDTASTDDDLKHSLSARLVQIGNSLTALSSTSSSSSSLNVPLKRSPDPTAGDGKPETTIEKEIIDKPIEKSRNMPSSPSIPIPETVQPLQVPSSPSFKSGNNQPGTEQNSFDFGDDDNEIEAILVEKKDNQYNSLQTLAAQKITVSVAQKDSIYNEEEKEDEFSDDGDEVFDMITQKHQIQQAIVQKTINEEPKTVNESSDNDFSDDDDCEEAINLFTQIRQQG